ncbi:hypothetical protein KNE206_77710 [Kitasatospora sp. NE20-6]|uniref:hypothetical protein n=1 Tax=Kitasatospora sp. NE20-6 TaxID=2859066 RepID=UPI0034DCAE8F
MSLVLLSVLAGLLLPVVALLLAVGRRWLQGPEALELPWRFLFVAVLAVLLLVIGAGLWSDATCGSDCEPVMTPVHP